MYVLLYINTGSPSFWLELLGTNLRKRLSLYTTKDSLLPRHSQPPINAKPAKPTGEDEAEWEQYHTDFAAWEVDAIAWQAAEDAHQEVSYQKIYAALKRLRQAIVDDQITWQDVKAKIDAANLEVRWSYPHSQQMELTDPTKVIQLVRMPFDEFAKLALLNKQGTITSVTPIAWGIGKSVVRPDDPDGTQHAYHLGQEIRDNLWQAATVRIENAQGQGFNYTTPPNVRQGYNQAWPPTVDDGEGGTINNPPDFLSFGNAARRRARIEARLNPVVEEQL